MYTCYWELTHLHVSADNLQLLLDVHDLFLRNLDNVRMGSPSLFLSLASPCFVYTYGLCSAVLTSRISIDIISSVFICQIWTSALSLPLVASASRVASFLKISLKFVLGREWSLISDADNDDVEESKKTTLRCRRTCSLRQPRWTWTLPAACPGCRSTLRWKPPRSPALFSCAPALSQLFSVHCQY